MNKPQTFNVKDVYEAVELAKNLKEEGKYDLFRGQTENWPLKSSFCRLDQDGQESVLDKLSRYSGWVNDTPGLESLAKKTDNMIAVAQHYGLSTNFIDFTTDPKIAGYFASNPSKIKYQMTSCIVCLNKKDLNEFWSSMSDTYEPIEFICLQVSGLWRLEAQCGEFLYCPHPNFENFYQLDRILFPYTEPLININYSDVYPERKSNLEILLDQFFMNELMIKNHHMIKNGIRRLL